MRAVLDVNVLVSALLSRSGAPGRLIALWLGGAFELVVSEALLAELNRALAYPKLREHVGREDAAAFIELLRSTASMFADTEHAAQISRDPGDDYLVALATASASILVSGDSDLLVLAPGLPIEPPAAFLGLLEG
ncbi:MAG TPA: putative toxin-antitoxin system toxin component, PIN family [Candidatus Dormibacteraeota bacterium]